MLSSKKIVPTNLIKRIFRDFSTSASLLAGDDKWKKLKDVNWAKKCEKIKAHHEPGPHQKLPLPPAKPCPAPMVTCVEKPSPPDPVCTPCPPCPSRHPDCYHPVIQRIPDIPLPEQTCPAPPDPPPGRIKCYEHPRPLGPTIDCPSCCKLAQAGIYTNVNFPKDVDEVTATLSELNYYDRRKSATISVSEPVELWVINSVPEEYRKNRIAFIYKPIKNVMQQGTNNLHSWRIRFDTKERWENPTMGWCSSGDSHSNLSIRFSSRDDAILYCERNKYKWCVLEQEAKKKLPKPKSYAQIFSWNRRTRSSTK